MESLQESHLSIPEPYYQKFEEIKQLRREYNLKIDPLWVELTDQNHQVQLLIKDINNRWKSKDAFIGSSKFKIQSIYIESLKIFVRISENIITPEGNISTKKKEGSLYSVYGKYNLKDDIDHLRKVLNKYISTKLKYISSPSRCFSIEEMKILYQSYQQKIDKLIYDLIYQGIKDQPLGLCINNLCSAVHIVNIKEHNLDIDIELYNKNKQKNTIIHIDNVDKLEPETYYF